MRVALFGYRGKVGQALDAALRGAGHEVVGVELGDPVEVRGCDAAIDFTQPAAVHGNVLCCIEQGVPVVIGTTGMTDAQVAELDERARAAGLPLFIAANFAIGAVLMMRFAAEAVRFLPKAEIIELHHDTKLDAPSGTARVTAERMGGGIPIHSVRLPGLVANQEVIFGAQGQTLTIRHDTTSREAFVPGVVLALERLRSLPPGLTHGLDILLGS
jgi:4-hydroxy-tetrahydrodipicolinate reductase